MVKGWDGWCFTPYVPDQQCHLGVVATSLRTYVAAILPSSRVLAEIARDTQLAKPDLEATILTNQFDKHDPAESFLTFLAGVCK